MADTQTNVVFIDGTGTARNQLSIQDSSGNIAPQTILRTNNGYVTQANPLPVTHAALAPSGVAPLAGSFTQTGVSGQFTPIAGRAFNIAVWATNGTARGSSLNGTVYLERSIDGGTTFLPVTGSGTELEIFTSVASDTWQESQVGVIYQLVCSAFTSGNPAINYYMSQ